MKLSNIYKLSGTGLLAISLAVIPFTKSGQAQTNTNPDIAVIETEEDSFDWGWLGLLGLLGLAGLAGKSNSNKHSSDRDNRDVVRGTEPFPQDVPSSTDSEYR